MPAAENRAPPHPCLPGGGARPGVEFHFSLNRGEIKGGSQRSGLYASHLFTSEIRSEGDSEISLRMKKAAVDGRLHHILRYLHELRSENAGATQQLKVAYLPEAAPAA